MPIRRPKKPKAIPVGMRRRRQDASALKGGLKDDATRAARITAVAALVGALVGALGAGIPAIVNSSNEISAQENRSRSEFLRQQQQTAYAAFIADQETFRKAEDAWYYAITLLPQNAQSAVEELHAARKKFALSYGNVRLVGSLAAVSFAKDLDRLHDSWGSRILDFYSLIPPAGPAVAARTPAQQQAVLDKANELFQLLSAEDEATAKFVEHARVDLGAT